MVRELNGQIVFWNRAAERSYGWSKAHAVGSVSHQLLNTVFPCPLEEINQELISKGVWEGELLHTLSDGSRVKVASRWQVVREGTKQTLQIVETNSNLAKVRPETSYLKFPRDWTEQTFAFLWRRKWWWLTPLVTVTLIAWAVMEFTSELGFVPLSE